MRWEDERYVRIYTRDTADWLALSFDAQALLCLLLRKVDRAGLLPLGKHGKRGVAAVLGHVGEWSRIQPALEELLVDGCIRQEGDVLVVGNFIEAQEAAMSDRQRKAEQRARSRDQAGTPRDQKSQIVTECHDSHADSHAPSQEVTPGHAASQVVTPCRAVPCRAEPEEAAAARASARDGAITKLGPGEAKAEPPPPSAEVSPGPAVPVQAGTAGPEEVPPSASIPTPTPAAVGHPAEAANPEAQARVLRAVAPPDDDVPLRPVPVLDTTELGEGAAELRWRLERRAEWKFLVAAHERRTEVRSKLEALVQALGVDRAEGLCWAVLERRKLQGMNPPKALAFFVGLLEEAAAGGDPMPPEVAGVDVDQVRAMHDVEVEARWAPVVAAMNPMQREAYEAEKRRLLGEVRAKGLWTSQEARELDEAEQFLFTKWSRRVADHAASAEA